MYLTPATSVEDLSLPLLLVVRWLYWPPWGEESELALAGCLQFWLSERCPASGRLPPSLSVRRRPTPLPAVDRCCVCTWLIGLLSLWCPWVGKPLLLHLYPQPVEKMHERSSNYLMVHLKKVHIQQNCNAEILDDFLSSKAQVALVKIQFSNRFVTSPHD